MCEELSLARQQLQEWNQILAFHRRMTEIAQRKYNRNPSYALLLNDLEAKTFTHAGPGQMRTEFVDRLKERLFEKGKDYLLAKKHRDVDGKNHRHKY